VRIQLLQKLKSGGILSGESGEGFSSFGGTIKNKMAADKNPYLEYMRGYKSSGLSMREYRALYKKSVPPEVSIDVGEDNIPKMNFTYNDSSSGVELEDIATKPKKPKKYKKGKGKSGVELEDITTKPKKLKKYKKKQKDFEYSSSHFVKNPKTGRSILKTSKLGKQILKDEALMRQWDTSNIEVLDDDGREDNIENPYPPEIEYFRPKKEKKAIDTTEFKRLVELYKEKTSNDDVLNSQGKRVDVKEFERLLKLYRNKVKKENKLDRQSVKSKSKKVVSKSKYVNDKKYIYNPDSGRYVKRFGETGCEIHHKKLMAKRAKSKK
jgi:hypothetical protein